MSGSDTSVSPGTEPVYPNENGMYQQLVNYWNAYEAKTYGFSVTLDVVPGGATAEHSEMLAAAQTHGEHYDIYNLDNQWVSEFADGGYIRPLQGMVNTNGFLTGPLRSAEDVSGQLYAVPFTTDVGLLYYRSNFVGAAKVRSLHSYQAMISLARSEMLQHPEVSEGYAAEFASYEGLTVNTSRGDLGERPSGLRQRWHHPGHRGGDAWPGRSGRRVRSRPDEASGGPPGRALLPGGTGVSGLRYRQGSFHA